MAVTLGVPQHLTKELLVYVICEPFELLLAETAGRVIIT